MTLSEMKINIRMLNSNVKGNQSYCPGYFKSGHFLSGQFCPGIHLLSMFHKTVYPKASGEKMVPGQNVTQTKRVPRQEGYQDIYGTQICHQLYLFFIS